MVLVLAIASFVAVPVIPAIVALVRAGRIVAWVHLGLWLAFLMVVLAVFGVLGAAVFRDWPPVARPRAPPSAVAW